MCKYINFNNLRKKKGLVGGGVVVGWRSALWKHKKQLRKHKKKKKNTEKQELSDLLPKRLIREVVEEERNMTGRKTKKRFEIFSC